MSRTQYVVVLAVVGAIWIAPHVQAKGDGPASVDAAWAKAMKANSLDEAMACYAGDAVAWFPNEAEAKGQKAVREAYEHLLKDFTIKDAGISDMQYKTFGKNAVGWGKWSLTVVEKSTGKTQEWKGRATTVLEKRDGRWVYLVDHASEEPKPREAAQAPPEAPKP